MGFYTEFNMWRSLGDLANQNLGGTISGILLIHDFRKAFENDVIH